MKKILIITNYGLGGVSSMLELFKECLKRNKVKFDICYYEPYSVNKNLSVPLLNFFFKRPKYKIIKQKYFKEIKIGCALPELEYKNHTGDAWKEIVSKYDKILNVSGTLTNSFEAVNLKKNIIQWVATPVLEDREFRIASKNFLRQLFDNIFIKPKMFEIEKLVLNYEKQKIFVLSDYTKNFFKKNLPLKNIEKLKYGIDTKKFFNIKNKKDKKIFTIGFIGRVDDPRKNVQLLIEIYSKIQQIIPNVKLKIIGGKKNFDFNIDRKKILYKQFITDKKLLREYYSSIDIFLVCSYQEGLCISALEAMACGSVVLSTPCKGTKEFIVNGKNGYYLSFDSDDFVKKIVELNQNKKKLKKMSVNSIRTIKNYYSKDIFIKSFNSQVQQYIS